MKFSEPTANEWYAELLNNNWKYTFLRPTLAKIIKRYNLKFKYQDVTHSVSGPRRAGPDPDPDPGPGPGPGPVKPH